MNRGGRIGGPRSNQPQHKSHRDSTPRAKKKKKSRAKTVASDQTIVHCQTSPAPLIPKVSSTNLSERGISTSTTNQSTSGWFGFLWLGGLWSGTRESVSRRSLHPSDPLPPESQRFSDRRCAGQERSAGSSDQADAAADCATEPAVG